MCFASISKPSFHLILNNLFQFPLLSACGLSNQSVPMSYSKGCVHAIVVFLGQNDLHSLSLHQDFKSSVTSMQRKRPQSTPQVPHERTQWSHLVLETFVCIPYRLLFFWHLLYQACFVIHWHLSQSVSLPFIYHLVQILVHVVSIQSIVFENVCLSWKQTTCQETVSKS